MIVAAALCPAPPLLVPEVTGTQRVGDDLRAACLASVAEILAASPDVVAVVGTAERTSTWDGESSFNLASFAPGRGNGGVDSGAAGATGTVDLPPSLGVGVWLLSEAGRAGCRAERVLQSVAHDEPPSHCADIGAELANLAGAAGRVALLAMADGSARRGLRAPGYLDERSIGFDAGVEQAVRSGRLEELLSIDQRLAADLMATGRPTWQVLAGALTGRNVVTEVRYTGDPFGVAYLVASFRVRREL